MFYERLRMRSESPTPRPPMYTTQKDGGSNFLFLIFIFKNSKKNRKSHCPRFSFISTEFYLYKILINFKHNISINFLRKYHHYSKTNFFNTSRNPIDM